MRGRISIHRTTAVCARYRIAVRGRDLHPHILLYEYALHAPCKQRHKKRRGCRCRLRYARSIARNGYTPYGRKKTLHAEEPSGRLHPSIRKVTGNSSHRIYAQMFYLLLDGIRGNAHLQRIAWRRAPATTQLEDGRRLHFRPRIGFPSAPA